MMEVALADSPKTRIAGCKGRILLADAEPRFRGVLGSALRKFGYYVAEVPDGLEVLRYLNLCNYDEASYGYPDVVVSGLHMPCYDGLRILRAMRASEWQMPFVLLAPEEDEALREEVEQLGAMAVMGRPLELGQVLTCIAQARRHMRLRLVS